MLKFIFLIQYLKQIPRYIQCICIVKEELPICGCYILKSDQSNYLLAVFPSLVAWHASATAPNKSHDFHSCVLGTKESAKNMKENNIQM